VNDKRRTQDLVKPFFGCLLVLTIRHCVSQNTDFVWKKYWLCPIDFMGRLAYFIGENGHGQKQGDRRTRGRGDGRLNDLPSASMGGDTFVSFLERRGLCTKGGVNP
jgi:hypothetical protein